MFGLKGILDKFFSAFLDMKVKQAKNNRPTKLETEDETGNKIKEEKTKTNDNNGSKPELKLIKNTSKETETKTSNVSSPNSNQKSFNRDYFYNNYRIHFGRLTQEQVDALNNLLTFIEHDLELTGTKHIAYVLATVYHETAHTFKPISEYGKGKGRRYGKPHKTTGKTYYGRGYVQLTWYDNYVKFSRLLGIDLVWNPDKANEPETAYKILSIGMRHGLYTGKKLSDYINNNKTDYRKARRIVNGNDKAHLIASYARKFEKCLKYNK